MLGRKLIQSCIRHESDLRKLLLTVYIETFPIEKLKFRLALICLHRVQLIIVEKVAGCLLNFIHGCIIANHPDKLPFYSKIFAIIHAIFECTRGLVLYKPSAVCLWIIFRSRSLVRARVKLDFVSGNFPLSKRDVYFSIGTKYLLF